MILSKAQIEELLDFSIDNETRLVQMSKYNDECDETAILEIIHTIANMYESTKILQIRRYIIGIINLPKILPMFKIILIQSLLSTDSNNKEFMNQTYELLIEIYKILVTSIPYKLELIDILTRDEREQTREIVISFLSEIINTLTVTAEYKYGHVLLRYEKHEWMIPTLMKSFIENSKHDVRYRLLAAQFLLSKKYDKPFSFLTSVAEEEKYDINTRADAADILLKYGDDAVKASAKKIIINLGKIGATNDTIYDNAQNAHVDEIEDSVKKGIEFLISMDNEYSKIPDPTLDEMYETISLDISEEEDELISSAIQRINFDRGIYSEYALSLKNIAIKVWKFINQHECKDELINRMREELIDIAGTCSSGYVSRLINVISGYTSFNLRISWRDQIAANLAGRLNAKARAIDNLNFQEKVLNEMAKINNPTGENNTHYNKKNFMAFFRECLPEIVAELQQEFAEHISDTDFELYLRYALMKYEGE